MNVYTRTITGQTTIFTPPPDCSSHWTYEGSFYNSIRSGVLMQNLLPGTGLDSTCFPPSFSANGRAPSSIQVYSPGACPDGYATPGAFNNQGTTTAICCQSGFSYYSVYSSINYFSTSALFLGCLSTFSGTTVVPARINNTDLVTTTVSGQITLWGQPVSVEYQQKDLSLFPQTTTGTITSSLSSSQTSSQTPSNTGSASSSPVPSESSAPEASSGLSTSAKAGIGVGAALGALLVIGLILFFVMRHRKNKLSRPGAGSTEPYRYQNGMGVGAGMEKKDDNGGQWARVEMDANQIHREELDGNMMVGATPGYYGPPVELPADNHARR